MPDDSVKGPSSTPARSGREYDSSSSWKVMVSVPPVPDPSFPLSRSTTSSRILQTYPGTFVFTALGTSNSAPRRPRTLPKIASFS